MSHNGSTLWELIEAFSFGTHPSLTEVKLVEEGLRNHVFSPFEFLGGLKNVARPQAPILFNTFLDLIEIALEEARSEPVGDPLPELLQQIISFLLESLLGTLHALHSKVSFHQVPYFLSNITKSILRLQSILNCDFFLCVIIDYHFKSPDRWQAVETKAKLLQKEVTDPDMREQFSPLWTALKNVRALSVVPHQPSKLHPSFCSSLLEEEQKASPCLSLMLLINDQIQSRGLYSLQDSASLFKAFQSLYKMRLMTFFTSLWRAFFALSDSSSRQDLVLLQSLMYSQVPKMITLWTTQSAPEDRDALELSIAEMSQTISVSQAPMLKWIIQASTYKSKANGEPLVDVPTLNSLSKRYPALLPFCYFPPSDCGVTLQSREV